MGKALGLFSSLCDAKYLIVEPSVKLINVAVAPAATRSVPLASVWRRFGGYFTTANNVIRRADDIPKKPRTTTTLIKFKKQRAVERQICLGTCVLRRISFMPMVIPLSVAIGSGDVDKRLGNAKTIGRRSDLKSKYLRADRPCCDIHGFLLYTLGEREVGDPYASGSVPDDQVEFSPARDFFRLELILVGLPVS